MVGTEILDTRKGNRDCKQTYLYIVSFDRVIIPGMYRTAVESVLMNYH